MNRLESYISEIKKLCEQYKVKSLYVFGSVLSNEFNNESDIDLIVDFHSVPVEDYADNYFDFKFSLQDILKRPVDLLEQKAIKNPFFLSNINKYKQMIYE